LAVFVGGWTLEVAERVCNSGNDLPINVLHGLAVLLEQNMICLAASLANIPRFTMLETIQEFALEQLNASGEAETLRQAHVMAMIDLAETAARAVGADQLTWFDRLEIERDNLRAALKHGSLEVLARLSIALADFWALRDRHYEGERWLELVLQQGEMLPRMIQAHIRAALGRLLQRRHDRALVDEQDHCVRICALLEASLADFRELNDQRAIADVLIRLGETLNMQNRTEEAHSAFTESLAIAKELREQRLMVWAQQGLGMVAKCQGAYVQAGALASECLALFRAMGDTHGCAYALLVLAQALQATGNLTGAEQRQIERLAYERELGHHEGVALTLMALADLALAQGNTIQATAHLLESLQIWRELGARQRMAETVEQFVQVAIAEGRDERADRLRAAATVLRDRASASDGVMARIIGTSHVTINANHHVIQKGSLMSRRDAIHFEVRDALIHDGWTITDDPFHLDYLTDELQVDLGTERLIAATRGIQRIAVEIKSFAGKSILTDAQQAIGQYIFYRSLLAEQEPHRRIYLALSEEAASLIDLHPAIGLVLAKQQIGLIVVNITSREVVEWRTSILSH
jgi:tetratricopeptide (TPR) repeat protein